MAKHYVVLCRKPNGSIVAYADAPMSMKWSHTEAYVLTVLKDYEMKALLKSGRTAKAATYQKKRNIESIRKYVNRIQKGHPNDDVFLARVGANSCPVKVDLSSKGCRNNRIMLK